jgi:hypothetical protein
MDVPRNHPGAFADVGLEHEEFAPEIVQAGDDAAVVQLRASNGAAKQFVLGAADGVLAVEYSLPAEAPRLSTEFGLSPDYLELLRCGSGCLEPIGADNARGFRNGPVSVCVRLYGAGWATPYQERFGHGCMLRAGSAQRSFRIEVVV